MNIVLVGAGGTGMSGVAGLLYDLGYRNIVCIDGVQSQLTDNLQKKGIQVIIGHGKYNPNPGDAIIYSEAAVNSIEIAEAKHIGRESQKMMLIMNYFQFLGEISKYFRTIGITGTNGKSSTTALTLFGAKKTEKFGLGILGALVPDFNGQSYTINPNQQDKIKTIFDRILTGKGTVPQEYIKELFFIVEACEYKRHFLYLDLEYTAITSLEFDHADYYKDFDDYKSAYLQMLNKLKQKAFVLGGFLKTFPEFSTYADKIQEIQEKEFHFDRIFGPHVNKNATLADAIFEVISPDKKVDISDFKGLRRRLEIIGQNNLGAQIISDYGHMASSIKIGQVALRKKFPNKKLAVIFQPHQINRIFTGRNDFLEAFKGYDEAFIYNIYAARENIQDFDFSSKNDKIHNLLDLGNVFAQECGGTYITDEENLYSQIDKYNQDRIVTIFTAGDLDYQMRKKYPKA